MVATEFVDLSGAQFGISGGTVQTRSDRSRSHVDDEQFITDSIEASNAIVHHSRVGCEFLTKRHRNSILILGTPHLDDVRKFLRLCCKRLFENFQCRECFVNGGNDRDLQRSWVSIIGRLRTVYVIVRMAKLVVALLVTQDLEGHVRNDLVRVHVRRSPCSALDHVDDEVFMKLPSKNPIAGFHNRLGNSVV